MSRDNRVTLRSLEELKDMFRAEDEKVQTIPESSSGFVLRAMCVLFIPVTDRTWNNLGSGEIHDCTEEITGRDQRELAKNFAIHVAAAHKPGERRGMRLK